MTEPATTGAPYREPWRPPPPPLPPLLGLAIGALLAAALAAFTTNKLIVMARLRGDMDGVDQRELTLSRLHRRFNEKSAVYLLTDPSSPDAPPFRIQLQSYQIARYRYGESLRVRCDDDRDCYLPDSVYIDDGNRAFDLALLTVELGAAIGCTWAAARRMRAWRRAVGAASARKAR